MTAVEQAELAESEALQGGPIAPAVIETPEQASDPIDETHDDLTEDAMTPSSSEAATESTTTPGLRKRLGGLGS